MKRYKELMNENLKILMFILIPYHGLDRDMHLTMLSLLKGNQVISLANTIDNAVQNESTSLPIET